MAASVPPPRGMIGERVGKAAPVQLEHPNVDQGPGAAPRDAQHARPSRAVTSAGDHARQGHPPSISASSRMRPSAALRKVAGVGAVSEIKVIRASY